MASSSTISFGFELLYKLVESQVNKKEDVIIILAHWAIIKNGFRCIGLGDSQTFDGNDEGSEALPDGWNNEINYSLRYIEDESRKLFILNGIKADENLLLNLLKVDDGNTSEVQFPIETTVTAIRGSLATMIPDYQTTIDKLAKELVDPVRDGTVREISTQTVNICPSTAQNAPPPPRAVPLPPRASDDPLRVGPPRPVGREPWNPEVDVRGIGRHDLDPFAGVAPRGGGMIFDPFSQNRGIPNPMAPHRPGGIGGPARLPPGAIPPGARFDPFGPPDNDRPRPGQRNPDHDHLPPPGYDDMFM